MIQFNEAMKYSWLIKYSVLDENDKFETLAEGHTFDFIPNVGDNIRIENVTYKVILRTMDFDNSIIWISLYNDKK